jgi:hypothetical protein
LRAVPGELIARRRDAKGRAECRFAIVADDEVPFDVSVDPASEWLTASTETKPAETSEYRHMLLVEIDMDRYPTVPDGEAPPSIVLLTTHPRCKQVRVPVRLLVE